MRMTATEMMQGGATTSHWIQRRGHISSTGVATGRILEVLKQKKTERPTTPQTASRLGCIVLILAKIFTAARSTPHMGCNRADKPCALVRVEV